MIGILNFISQNITLLSIICNVIICLIIKYNDLSHLEKTVNKLDTKMDELSERVSNIEGQLIVK